MKKIYSFSRLVLVINFLFLSFCIHAQTALYTVTGGGSLCSGGTGVDVGLDGSSVVDSYQLYHGLVPVGSIVAGTGYALDFGLQATAGTYTVVANPSGSPTIMYGVATVIVNPLPTAYAITGGGSFCAGDVGVHIGLAASDMGITYLLYNGALVTGGASGTGAAVDFGLQTTAGTYSVVATDVTTGCSGSMTGTTSVTVKSSPNIYNVTGGGSYCSGTGGVDVSLSASDIGVNYQLFNSGVSVGSAVAGNGSSLDFGPQIAAGTYTVVATDASTLCSSNMTGSAVINIIPLPTVHYVTGGGGYCSGGTGVHVGLNGSDIGVNYKMYISSILTGTPMAGTGLPLDFGLQTAPGAYTISAVDATTGCNIDMIGFPWVSINPLPVAETITGGGSYCPGGTGVHIGLTNSDFGVYYQLYNVSTPVGDPEGTGTTLDFGLQTATGIYSVVATNLTTGCSNNMSGNAVVSLFPLPTPYNVTGGGSYCAGGTGLNVGLVYSTAGTSYQLYNGITTAGTPVVSMGFPFDFGLQLAPGTYTVVATDTLTTCSNLMAGSASISIDPLPSAYPVTGGGSYCTGGTGVDVGLGNSDNGLMYQLYNGSSALGLLLAGSGSALDFGIQMAAGTYSVVATNLTTGCVGNMTGTASVVVNALPLLHSVIGGGSYCAGGTGVHVGLESSEPGVPYQLYLGATPVGIPVMGAGTAVDFGLQTTPGVYTVIADNGTPFCARAMVGSATVSINPLPVIYNVTGGGNYCPGGTGVHVGLSNSNPGIFYQLYYGGTSTGAPLYGSGYPLDFGLQTAGTYTVVASDVATSCTNSMNGVATVGMSLLPAVQNVTGGGNYCAGGTGVHVRLDASETGTHYQLYVSGTTTGSAMVGTGFTLDFGLQTIPGAYTVLATNTTTGCTNVMNGSANVVSNALPTIYTAMGGGSYCAGDAGEHILLAGSDVGISYQLYNGAVAVGFSVGGSGSSIDFGLLTNAGTYTVVATNSTTTCSINMAGSPAIVVNQLPSVYTVMGGGSYCAGSGGLHVTLSGSNTGIDYVLYNGAAVVSTPRPGTTGTSIDFGTYTAAGNYTAVATDAITGCASNMAGSTAISINPLPVVQTVLSSGSSYCAGGTGVSIALSGSEVGTTYQLYNGLTTVGGPLPGSGSAISFGSITLPGSYTIVAVNSATSCTDHMSGTATVAVNPLPPAHMVSGGGSYCNGGTGVHVGLAGSNSGLAYQLYHNGVMLGGPVLGTGSSIDFGLQTLAGSYTVVALNTTTICTSNMTGNATITINALPNSYAVTGGGSYCAGGAGVHVGLGYGNPGINYQLYNGTAMVGRPVAGTGLAPDFGLQTAAGSYTVIATNAATGCTSNMAGNATISINPLPGAYLVTGGGTYCPGGTGVHVGVSGSGSGINYQLYNGTSIVGGALPGTGSVMDFGLQTAPGVYTVVATDHTTGCTNNMTGSPAIAITPAPDDYPILGGGHYCSGGAGVAIGIANSAIGVNYTLYNGFTTIGTLPGTGAPMDFGLLTSAGTYTALATGILSGCTTHMSGSAVVIADPSVTPSVSISTGVGDSVCSGNMVTFTAIVVNGGTAPTYQWKVNGVLASVNSTYSYIPLNGDAVSVMLTSSEHCATPSSVYALTGMTVQPYETPVVNVSAIPGDIVCRGNPVNFIATPSYCGNEPTFQWMKNGVSVGTSPTYNYLPADGDDIYCVVSSNYRCRRGNTASSSHVAMQVIVPVTPTVSITATPGNNIDNGEMVTLAATVTNGGLSPTYQWLVDNVPVPGATTPTYASNTFANHDVVTCQVLSSGTCDGLVGTGSLTMNVYNVGVKQITGSGDIMLVPNPSKGVFTIKGAVGNINDEVSIEVTDMLGQVIYKRKVMANNGDINETIQLNKMVANGMYLLNLRSGAEHKTLHIVVEK